jgi:hypothetical protein
VSDAQGRLVNEVHAREVHAHEVHASEMIVSGLHRHRRYRRFLPTRVQPEGVGTLPASTGKIMWTWWIQQEINYGPSPPLFRRDCSPFGTGPYSNAAGTVVETSRYLALRPLYALD